MLECVKFEGGFQAAITAHIRGWIGVLGASLNPPGGPDRIEVNIDDWTFGGGCGMCMRFLEFTWEGYKACEAYPSPYVPRGTLVAMWRERRREFAADLWRKWYDTRVEA